MDRSNYKRLGDYIATTDVRNRDLNVSRLLGVSVDKTMFPSIANTIGTDFSTYKILYPGQFVYIPDTSRRGDKIAISLLSENEKVIVSSAYTTFEVLDTNKLHPEYLMMWFRRPEFDRYARFKSNGSAREIFSWDEMCEVYLPVPDIATQRRIVAEYQAVEKRIAMNERLIAKLEETAQAIYKKMFVDDIDPAHLPDGWRIGGIDEIAKLKAGGDKPVVFSETKTNLCNVPIYANSAENEGIFGYTDKAAVTARSVTITARGTIGYCFLRSVPFFPIVRLVVITPNDPRFAEYLFYYYSNEHLEGDGSVQSQLTVPQLIQKPIIIPAKSVVVEFDRLVNPLDNSVNATKKENELLQSMKSLLLAKMCE